MATAGVGSAVTAGEDGHVAFARHLHQGGGATVEGSPDSLVGAAGQAGAAGVAVAF